MMVAELFLYLMHSNTENYDNNSYKFCGDHKVHCNYTIYQKI